MKSQKMGFLQRLVILVLVVLLILSLGASLYLSGMTATQMASARQYTQPLASGKPHVFVQVSDIDTAFRDAFLVGAQKAADEYNLELEVADIRDTGGSESYVNAMEAAIDAHVDGIILQPAWRSALKVPVQRAVEKKIPLITVGEDMPASNRNCFVGVNSFEFGNLAARLVGEATDNQAKIAVVFRGLNQDNDTESSLKLDGLKDVVGHYGGMDVVRIEQGTNAFFGAEGTFRDILTQNPQVNVLVCMTAIDTVAAVQTVLDLNRLQYVQVVGTDVTPEISALLDKKVLYGTISRKPEDVGYQSVEAMSRIFRGESVPDFIDVGLETIQNK